MCKDKEQQKKAEAIQQKMFERAEEPRAAGADGISKRQSVGVELSSLLENQRTLTENILEKIVDYENLKRAYKQLRANGGSAGIDGMEIGDLREWLGRHVEDLRAQLLAERYEVSAVRKVTIPKPSGGERILGIPTTKDRFIQQAIHQELSRYYDPQFSDYSYGFRPNRSASQAIVQASSYIREGKEWVVDIDLENFFDRINHDRLMQRLSKGIGDKRLLRLIKAYLTAGMMEGGLCTQRTSGTPQGGPLSPLLSNIVLDELDKELERRGHSFCRYADDCNIYVTSKKSGERVMDSIVKFIENKLKLKVNRGKSGVRHCSDVKFLGYTILPGGGIRVADKSITSLKNKVREITKRNRGVSFSQVILELNAVLIGWSNYFGLANKWLSTIRDIDGWIRRRLRCYKLKQSGRKYTIFKMLSNAGIAVNKSWNVVMFSQGWWAMSNKLAVTQALNLEWFAQQGLQSLYLRMKV